MARRTRKSFQQETGAAEDLSVICKMIRHYREQCGMEQKALASALGITSNSVSNWENGRSRPDVDLLPAICAQLHISLYELFALSSPAPSWNREQQAFMQQFGTLSEGHRKAVCALMTALQQEEENRCIPELRVLMRYDRSLAAGIGDPTEFECHSCPLYVYASAKTARADSVFSVSGDSMEPVFHQGQEVLVQRLSPFDTLQSGEIGAFIVGNETYIKEYRPDGLHSFHPDYPVMQFGEEESVYLIGRVLGVLLPEDYASQEEIERYRRMEEEA